jgi:predicted acyl esterase
LDVEIRRVDPSGSDDLHERPSGGAVIYGVSYDGYTAAATLLGESADQRFVDHRPDVLTYVSAPLTEDLTITGPVSAELYASTSGTDSDFIVKLIDEFPEVAQKLPWDPKDGPAPGQFAQTQNGYQLPIAMEVRRGRYLASFEHPRALRANQPMQWDLPE